jgi:FkbM family methyltransferase
LNKLHTHVRDIALARNLNFTFYRFLHILDRRISLPNEVFIGDHSLFSELLLEQFLITSQHRGFIDIGAKVGLWTSQLAKRCSEVHAFETHPQSYAILKRNTKKHNHVTLYRCALGEENGLKDFFVHTQPSRNSFVIKSEDYIGTIKVPIRTLDSFNFNNVDLIKIDTEGYELPILKGGQQTIRREKPQLYIEIHLPEQITRIGQLLQEWGYSYVIYNLKIDYNQC